MLTVLLVSGCVIGIAGAVLAVFTTGIGRRIGLATVAAVLASAILLASLHGFVFDYASRIGDLAGISDDFVILIGTAGFIAAVNLVVYRFSAHRQHRRAAAIGLTVLSLGALSSVAFLGLDQRVTQEGGALQCYVIEETGVRWKDIRFEGIDPETGRPCERAEPYLIPVLNRLDERLKRGEPLTPIEPDGRYFSTIGDPIVWFSKSAGGKLTFYDAPGYDPMTGTRLQPVSPEVVNEAQEQAEAELARAEAERERVEEEARKQAEQAEEKARQLAEQAEKRRQAQQLEAARLEEEARRLDLVSTVIEPGCGDGCRPSGIALFPESSAGGRDELATQLLLQQLSAPSEVVPIFSEAFAERGYLETTLGGDATPVLESGALELVEQVILGTVEVGCGPNPVDEDLVNCVVRVAYRRVGKEGVTSAWEQFSETGPGLSDELAIARAVEFIGVRHSQIMLEGEIVGQ